MSISLFGQMYLNYRVVSISGNWVKCIQEFFLLCKFFVYLNLEWFLDFSEMIVEFMGKKKITVFRGKTRVLNSLVINTIFLGGKSQMWVENSLQKSYFPNKITGTLYDCWEMQKNVV